MTNTENVDKINSKQKPNKVFRQDREAQSEIYFDRGHLHLDSICTAAAV